MSKLPRTTRAVRDDETSRFGLPKNTVETVLPRSTSEAARAWVRARDEFEAMLLDALDALRFGLISHARYDREKATISRAKWQAEQRLAQALATSSPHHSGVRTRRPR